MSLSGRFSWSLLLHSPATCVLLVMACNRGEPPANVAVIDQGTEVDAISVVGPPTMFAASETSGSPDGFGTLDIIHYPTKVSDPNSAQTVGSKVETTQDTSSTTENPEDTATTNLNPTPTPTQISTSTSTSTSGETPPTDGMPMWPDSATPYCSSPLGELDCDSLHSDYQGQDGVIRGRIPSLTNEGNLVLDDVTLLYWAAGPVQERTWLDANTYCDGISIEGIDTWRLPSRFEVLSLIDFGAESTDSIPAPLGPLGLVWTDTIFGFDNSKHWAISGSTSTVGPIDSSDTAVPLCVSGDTLIRTFGTRGDTALETFTQLEWQKSDLSDTYSWTGALNYCTQLEHGEFDDWRLASVKELYSIVNEGAQQAPTIDPEYFGEYSSPNTMWSSTPTAGQLKMAWLLEPEVGTARWANMEDEALVRCVRDVDLSLQ